MATILFACAPPPQLCSPLLNPSRLQKLSHSRESLEVKEEGRGPDQKGKESLTRPPEPPSAQQTS